MSDEQMPGDPFSSYDAERIAKETGGQITARIVWEGVTRLTIGALEHPHETMRRTLNTVAVRIYDLDGQLAGEIRLGANDVDDVFRGLHEAVAICWPAPPDPDPLPLSVDWDAPDDDDPCPRCGYIPGAGDEGDRD